MEPSSQPVVLLGPQRHRPGVAAALADLEVEGPIAVVTAGWQEREAEVEELEAHVGRPARNLMLYRRYEEALHRDSDLARGLRERQDRLHELQQLYRLRLAHALAAARELMHRRVETDLVLAERRSAIRAIRTLDGAHLRRIRAVHRDFEETWRPSQREVLARHREHLRDQLEECSGLAVAGGHVTVLLNRMRLFDLLPFLAGKPIVAWSAGAMVLAERIVLFHDSPPQGPGNAEVLDAGLGLVPKFLPLPHASKRLDLEDRRRVAIFARRFAPSISLALDEGCGVEVRGKHYRGGRGTKRLNRRGGLSPVGRA